ncbi:MAG: cytochrome c [Candidatus Sumerlaeaceae bacterium]|nr:cytochrome c [Candidatus Sumerlaeaceae bacterium]
MRYILKFRRAGAMICVAAAALAFTGCRQKMADQPSIHPAQSSAMFADGMGMRPQIEHTVARGHLRDDSPLFSGKANGKFVEAFPFTITKEVIARGQNRYNIYCAPCHSALGDGSGMIVQRGFPRPVSFHDDRLLTAPVGYYYDVMTNGFGRMYDVASQTSPNDRWAITAYIRALQISRKGTIEDVPETERAALMADAKPAADKPKADGSGHGAAKGKE